MLGEERALDDSNITLLFSIGIIFIFLTLKAFWKMIIVLLLKVLTENFYRHVHANTCRVSRGPCTFYLFMKN